MSYHIIDSLTHLTLIGGGAESIQPILDSVFPFDEAPKAFERLMQGRYVRTHTTPTPHPTATDG